MLRRLLLAIISIALIVGLGTMTPAAASFGTTVPLLQMSTWGSPGAGNGQFNGALDVAVDPASGNVYVADVGNDRVQRFTADGAFLGAFNRLGRLPGGPTLEEPVAIAVGGGNVYVEDRTLGQIVRYSLTGTFLNRWDVPSRAAMPVGVELRADLAADATGNVYVLTDSAMVQKYSPAGALLLSFGLTGIGNGYNLGLAVAPSGEIFVTGLSGDITKFSAAGVVISTVHAADESLVSLAIDAGGNLWTLQFLDGHQLYSFTPSGVQRGAAGNGPGPPLFTSRGGVAASTTPGVVYVTDNNRVVKVTEAGRLLLTFDADANGSVDRTFTVSGPGPTQSLPVDDDTDPALSNTVALAGLMPGTWHVDLTNVPDSVKSITCSNGVHTANYEAHAVDIALAPGQTISCNFYAEWIG